MWLYRGLDIVFPSSFLAKCVFVCICGQMLPLLAVVAYVAATKGPQALGQPDVLLFGVTTLIGLTATLMALSTLTGPLRDVSKAFQKVKSHREYRTFPSHHKDSVGRLMAVFGPIAQALGAKLDQRYSQSHINPLTGVLDQVGFEAALARQGEGTLVKLNIDNFEALRTDHGETFADALLALAGHALRDELRTGDLVGHTGEREFGVWLKGAGRVVSRHVAERLCAAVKTATVNEMPDLTLSVGLAVRGDKEALEDLMPRVDVAWQHAKETGDRVEMAQNAG